MIAGLRVQDGILLCSDTEWASDAVKVYDRKIFTHQFRGGLISIAIAGNEGCAKMAIQDCTDELHADRKRAYTAKEVKRIVRDAFGGIYERYVSKKSGAARDEAEFELLAAIRLHEGGLHLLSTARDAIFPVDRYACLGLGWHVGIHVIGSFYDPNMRVKDAVIVVIKALGAAKRQVPAVGGYCQFLLMTDEKVSDVIDHDHVETERLITEYERATDHLLLRLGDFELSNASFKEKMLNFDQLVTKLRAEWAAASASYRDLIEGLSKPA